MNKLYRETKKFLEEQGVWEEFKEGMKTRAFPRTLREYFKGIEDNPLDVLLVAFHWGCFPDIGWARIDLKLRAYLKSRGFK